MEKKFNASAKMLAHRMHEVSPHNVASPVELGKSDIAFFSIKISRHQAVPLMTPAILPMNIPLAGSDIESKVKRVNI